MPAVALTAYADAESARRAIRSGYQVHLSKPIQTEHLIRTLAALRSRTPAAGR